MKTKNFSARLFFSFGVFIISAAAPASADTINADSKITSVVVFPDRASVSRTAEVEIPAGSHQVVFKNLPGAIEPGSLTSKGEGQAKVKLFGVRILTEQLEQAQPQRVHDLEEQIRKLNEQKEGVLNTKKVTAAKEEFLKSIKAASSEQIGKELVTKTPAAADVEKLIDVLDRGLSEVYDKNHNADQQLFDLDQQIDKLQRELAQIQGNYDPRQQVNAAVDVEAETSGKFTLQISYRVPGASWEPVYEARAVDGSKEVQFIADALIRQNTGEDWKEVQLEISTARPALGGRMPEIEPWYIAKQEPVLYNQMKSGFLGRAEMRDAAAVSMESQAAPAAAPVQKYAAEIPVSSIQTQGSAVHYKLPRRESIASDAQPRKVTLTSSSLPAEFAYETTPRLSPQAYLRAKAVNNTDAVFLPGQVQIFYDSAFVGTSSIDLVGLGEKFDLYLGVNDKIRVEQKQLKAKEDVSVLPGLHGKIKTIDYAYVTTVENFQKEDADVVVFDQIPVSQNDEIKIENVIFDPKPSEQIENKPGVQSWKFKVPAGKKQQVKVSYTVKYPVDFAVTNL